MLIKQGLRSRRVTVMGLALCIFSSHKSCSIVYSFQHYSSIVIVVGSGLNALYLSCWESNCTERPTSWLPLYSLRSYICLLSLDSSLTIICGALTGRGVFPTHDHSEFPGVHPDLMTFLPVLAVVRKMYEVLLNHTYRSPLSYRNS